MKPSLPVFCCCTLLLVPYAEAADNAAAPDQADTVTKPAVARSVDIEQLVAEAAQDTVIQADLLAASWRRDKEVARELEMEMRIRRKVLGRPQKLSSDEISQVLTFDFHRPKLHLQALDLAAEALQSDTASSDPALNEFMWQEIEYLHMTQASEELLAKTESLKDSLPDRDCQPSPNLLAAATRAFQAGLPMYIELEHEKPLTMGGGMFERFQLPLKYVRSPSFPPRGCRIAAQLVVKRDGPDMLVSHHTGYQPCAFLVGSLQGEFFAMGQVPIDEDSRLFVFATTLYDDKQHAAVPISNIISIPVVGPVEEDIQAKAEQAKVETDESQQTLPEKTQPTATDPKPAQSAPTEPPRSGSALPELVLPEAKQAQGKQTKATLPVLVPAPSEPAPEK